MSIRETKKPKSITIEMLLNVFLVNRQGKERERKRRGEGRAECTNCGG